MLLQCLLKSAGYDNSLVLPECWSHLGAVHQCFAQLAPHCWGLARPLSIHDHHVPATAIPVGCLHRLGVLQKQQRPVRQGVLAGASVDLFGGMHASAADTAGSSPLSAGAGIAIFETTPDSMRKLAVAPKPDNLLASCILATRPQCAGRKGCQPVRFHSTSRCSKSPDDNCGAESVWSACQCRAPHRQT